MKPDKRLLRWGLLTGLSLAAFAAIILLADQVFEHVPHSEDEVAYIFQAKVLARNRLAVPTPANKPAFWTPFVVDYEGQRFGKYPPGWPLLLSLGLRLGAPWLVNAWLGMLTLALVARLGHRFYGFPVGVVAAALGLVTPGFLFLSASLLSHAASLFWATLALGLLYRLASTETRQPLYALATGLALGAVFLTRPFAALGVGLPVGLFVLILAWRGELPRLSLPWLGLGAAAVAALGPLYWWAITGDPRFNAYLLVWPYDRPGFGPDVGPYGYSLGTALFINTRLKLVTLGRGLFGWPGWSSLLFLPLPFVARRATRWDWLLLGTIAGMVFVHLFYWAYGGEDGGFPRYYYDALPALLLLTARGIHLAARWKLGWLPVGLVLLFIGYNLAWNMPPLLAAQKGKYHITPAPLEVVEQANLSEPALVIVNNVERWSDFAAPFAANSPLLDGPVVYAIGHGPEFNHRLQAQFSHRTCWVLEGPGLRRCNGRE